MVLKRKERVVHLERERLNLNSRRKKLKKVTKGTTVKEIKVDGDDDMTDGDEIQANGEAF